MDRMIFAGCLLLVMFGMFLGLSINKYQGDFNYFRSAFEIISFAGTSVTGVVAVYALSSWRKQYLHAEKHSQLKALRNSGVGLETLMDYLSAVSMRIPAKISGASDEAINRYLHNEAHIRVRWNSSLGSYQTAWESVRPFLSKGEDLSFKSRPELFINLERELTFKLENEWASLKPPQMLSRFTKLSDEVLKKASESYQDALDEITELLRKHLGT